VSLFLIGLGVGVVLGVSLGVLAMAVLVAAARRTPVNTDGSSQPHDDRGGGSAPDESESSAGQK
jgi:hypothetical protein